MNRIRFIQPLFLFLLLASNGAANLPSIEKRLKDCSDGLVKKLLMDAIAATSVEQGMLSWSTEEERGASVRLARLLASPSYEAFPFTDEEARTVAQARQNWLARKKNLFGGHNQLLSQISLTGPGFPDPGRGYSYIYQGSTLADIVNEESWNKRGWWLQSRPEPLVAQQLFADITASTSRSPLAALVGSQSERVISWNSYVGHPFPTEGYQLDLNKIRVATNYALVDGKRSPKSLEILVQSDGWKGFYFEYVEGEWFPSQTFNGDPIEVACLRCHKSETQPGQLSPRPFFLKTKAELKQVGYLNGDLITRLLQY